MAPQNKKSPAHNTTTPQDSARWFPIIRPCASARLRLICFPFAGGSPSSFASWVTDIADGVEVRALNLPGRWQRFAEPPIGSLSQLVPLMHSAYSQLSSLPSVFLGHSNGALIAYSLLCELFTTQLVMVKHWIISAKPAPHIKNPVQRHTLSDQALLEELARFGGTPSDVLQHPELMRALLPIVRADFSISETYQVEDSAREKNKARLNMPVSLWWGKQDTLVDVNHVLAWQEYVRVSCEANAFEGDHFYILNKHNGVVTKLNHLLKEIVCENID